MNILVVGLSPYLITSRSKIYALIMKHLYMNGHSVAGATWAHDISYFVPDADGKSYYEFEIQNNSKYKIPLFLFNRGKNESIEFYEIANSLHPDMIITVGDYTDFLYMKAIKVCYNKPFKWIFVLLNYSYPINENYREMIQYADSILCLSQFGYDAVKEFYKKDSIDVAYIGCDTNYVHSNSERGKDDKFRIITIGKCYQTDNIPTIMESVHNARKINKNIELYIHANIHDTGDYDLELIRDRVDPYHEYIQFPDKCVSLHEGITDIELMQKMSEYDLFISVPLISATSISVFDAIMSGCFPLLSDCGSNTDLVNLITNENNLYKKEDFLVPCVKLMSTGCSYLNACSNEELTKKIIYMSEKNLENKKGMLINLEEFTKRYNREGFLSKLLEVINTVEISDQVICI